MATDSAFPVPDAAATLPPGTRLGKYEVVRRLGAGGMGTVYEAIHAEIGKRVAVKVLSPAVAAMEGARARFLREAQLTSKVRHLHAVDVTDMGTEGDHSYLVMELLSGEDLATRLARDGRMDPHELVDIVLAVCSAVMAAHRAGIIHRDLKPQNIFLAEGVHGLVPEGARLRHLEGAGRVDRARADQHGIRPRHAVLPRARTGRRQPRLQPSQRPVRDRNHPVRVSDQRAALRGREPVHGVPGHRRGQPDSPAPAPAGAGPGSGGRRVARDRDRAVAALPVGRRSRARPVALRR